MHTLPARDRADRPATITVPDTVGRPDLATVTGLAFLTRGAAQRHLTTEAAWMAREGLECRPVLATGTLDTSGRAVYAVVLAHRADASCCTPPVTHALATSLGQRFGL